MLHCGKATLVSAVQAGLDVFLIGCPGRSTALRGPDTGPDPPVAHVFNQARPAGKCSQNQADPDSCRMLQ
jgi:hypothetical protein